MIIYNEITEEGFLNITDKTTKVFIGIFGFYPHDRESDLQHFLTKELGLTEQKNSYDPDTVKGSEFFEVYNVCDRRTVDLGHVLTIGFNTEEEAEKFILEKIKSSDYVNLKMFTEIEFIDGDLFVNELRQMRAARQKRNTIKNQAKQEVSQFLDAMKIKHSASPEILKAIKDLVKE